MTRSRTGRMAQFLFARRGLPHALAGLVFLLARASAAQVVVVSVADSASGHPLPGVLVTLVTTQGARIESRVANSSARAVVRAANPGRYAVRVERVGYRPWSSSPIALAAGDTVRLDVAVGSFRVVLPEVTVSGRTECLVNPALNQATATVWEEARKALEASRLAERDELVTMELLHFERLTTPRGVLREESVDTILAAVRSSPYATATSAELVRVGWVQGDLEVGQTGHYHAPDADVLLSEEFLGQHCFTLVDSVGAPGLVGLAFRPVPSRRLPDVRGVLWLDRATAELRSLLFEYVNVRPALFGTGAGGRLDFRRLPEGGAWIVEGWEIRMPLVAGYMSRNGLTDARLWGFRAQGGRVARVLDGTAWRREYSDGS